MTADRYLTSSHVVFAPCVSRHKLLILLSNIAKRPIATSLTLSVRWYEGMML